MLRQAGESMTATEVTMNSRRNVVPRIPVQIALCATLLLSSACSTQRAAISDKLGGLIPKSVALPQNDQTFKSRFYGGAGMGQSRLDPDLSQVGFTLQNGNKIGTELKLGYDMHNLFSVELDTAVLGAAELEATAEVEYTSFSVSGLVYGLTGAANRSRREKLSAFARLGYGYSSVASNVEVLDGRDLSGPILGLGVEYGFRSGLGLRLEAKRFHDEATMAGLSAIYRFGDPRRLLPSVLARNGSDIKATDRDYSYTEPHDGDWGSPKLGAAVAGGNYGSTPKRIKRVVVASANDLDGDGIDNGSDECANTPAGTSVDSEGCGLFDGVLEGVTFANGSSRLDRTAKKILDRLVIRLLAFPEVVVGVRAHTDSKGPEYINQSVSETRARAVVAYLSRAGVSKRQLKPMGVGESQPRETNETEEGRLMNRRIELVTLPDRDIAPTHVTVLATARNKGKKSAQKSEIAAISEAGDAAPVLAAALPQSDVPAFPAQPEEATAHELSGVIEGVAFKTGTETLLPESEPALDAVAGLLRTHASARVVIMAHTDDQGPAEANLTLSAKQAARVAKYLESKGISADRMEVEGYGESLPVAQNVTERDRASNRRIELRVLTN